MADNHAAILAAAALACGGGGGAAAAAGGYRPRFPPYQWPPRGGGGGAAPPPVPSSDPEVARLVQQFRALNPEWEKLLTADQTGALQEYLDQRIFLRCHYDSPKRSKVSNYQ